MRQSQRGYTLMEVLIASSIIAVSLVPLLQALEGIGDRGGANVTMLQHQLKLAADIETVLAQDFNDLLVEAALVNEATIPTNFSDAPGSEPRTLVFLSFYDLDDSDGDGNPFTIDDPNTDGDNNPYTGGDVTIDVLWVKATLENSVQSLQTLTLR